jgi:hypothetical protein
MSEIEDALVEWENVTGNTLPEEDKRLLVDFLTSGCRKICEVV